MMKFKVVANIIGFLLILNGFFILTGIGFSLYYSSDDIFALLISGVGTSLIGFVLWISTRRSEISELGKREGYLIVTFGWIAMAIFGAFPFLIYGAVGNYTDAFFETMSGFTTTGATILTDIEILPPGPVP